jgi:hypothetical protein
VLFPEVRFTPKHFCAVSRGKIHSKAFLCCFQRGISKYLVCYQCPLYETELFKIFF